MTHTPYAIVVATPDLVQLRLIPALLARLGHQGLFCFGALPSVLADRDVVHLYDGRTTHARTDRGPRDSLWLAQRLFGAGPSLTLFLRANSGEDDLQQRVRDLKGGSRSGDCQATHLRGLSPACDRGLSLVHSPDNAQALIEELEVMFGPGLAKTLDQGIDKNLPLEFVHHIAGPSMEDESRHTTLQSVCATLLRAVCLVAADPESGVDALDVQSIVGGLISLRDDLLPGSSEPERIYWSALAELLPAVRALHSKLAETGCSPEDLQGYCRFLSRLQVTRVLADCCGREKFTTATSGLLAESLERLGWPLGTWEKQRAHVTAAFHRSI